MREPLTDPILDHLTFQASDRIIVSCYSDFYRRLSYIYMHPWLLIYVYCRMFCRLHPHAIPKLPLREKDLSRPFLRPVPSCLIFKKTVQPLCHICLCGRRLHLKRIFLLRIHYRVALRYSYRLLLYCVMLI